MTRVLSIVISVAVAGCLVLRSSPLEAQEIEWAEDFSSLALTYTKGFGTAVTVERSSDLVSWEPARTQDKIITRGEGTETIQSTLSLDVIDKVFVRLQLADAATVTLAWDAVSDPEVAGYRLYYGTASQDYSRQLDVGNNTKATISVPMRGEDYYIVVTCYNTAGLESGPSGELKVSPSP